MRRTQVGAWGATHPMLSEVDLISSVSGGSFTALAYALFGERLFDHYAQQFLKRDVGGELLKRLFDPLTWPQKRFAPHMVEVLPEHPTPIKSK